MLFNNNIYVIIYRNKDILHFYIKDKGIFTSKKGRM